MLRITSQPRGPKGTALIAAAIALALLAGCANTAETGDDEPSGGSVNSPSSAFFAVPESLTGSSVGVAGSYSSARPLTTGPTVQDQVGNTVEAYFAMVRDQVRFGAEVAESVKEILVELESVKVDADTYLLDYESNVGPFSDGTAIVKWTVIAPGSEWKLEQWTADADIDALGSADKEFELNFERNGSAYAGTVILNGDLAFTRDETAETVMPAMMRIEFDSGVPAGDTPAENATLTLYLQDFRSIGDIYDSSGAAEDLEDAIIKLSKNLATGAVSVASSIRVPNSRHFVWNGYQVNPTGGADILNTQSAGETRFYAARGISSGTAGDLATVELGLPETYADAATAFSDANALGPMIAALMTERLNNDYDFEGDTVGTEDDGHAILQNLRSLQEDLGSFGYTGTLLDNSSWVPGSEWTTSSAEVIAALTSLRDFIAENGTTVEHQAALDEVSYLLGVMSVVNPVYFAAAEYQDNGTAPNASYPAVAGIELPSEAEVTGLMVEFSE